MRESMTLRLLGITSLALALGISSACDQLLQVENPGSVGEDALQSEEALPVLVDGVYGDLQDAYDEVVLLSGLFTDELVHSGSFPTFMQIDDRTITADNVSLLDLYQEIATANFSADQAVENIRATLGADAESSPLLAEALALGGYARIFFADNFCQATIDAGPALSPETLYQQAEDLFTQAIQVATTAGEEDLLDLALVGRARTRLNLGDLSGAATDAALVSDDFVFLIEFATTSDRENNEVVVFTVDRREASIGDPFRNDARIPQCSVHPTSTVGPCDFATEGELGPDNETPLFVQLVYLDQETDIPLATGAEADLIEAEALGQDVSEDRAFDLYLRGQRLADFRRTDDPFLAGGDACFPIPEREVDTNPNL
ncbi:hypothetical protein BH18GEM1_BH18GEM1_03530 [soil metagenome]